jgi:AraC family L-rhamnose operon regulatory protein RhaS
MAEPVIFQDKDKVYYADTCEPLKQAAARSEIELRGWARGNYPGTALPQGLLPQLRSVGVWDAPRPQSWGLDLHCNEGIEFTYLAQGQTAFEVDGQQWMLHKGDLTITRPWQFHRVGNPAIGASRLVWLILDVDMRRPNQPWQWPDWLLCTSDELQRLTNLLRHNEQPVWQADAEIARCFAKLDHLLDASDPAACRTKLVLVINELIIALLDLLEQQQIPLDAHLSTTQRVVEMFLTTLPRHVEKPWTLESMAQECSLSRSQFSTHCKQIVNMSPIAFLTACRVEAAARLLVEQPTLSVTQIAYATGFNSSQYFSTVFQKFNGVSPSTYRSSQLV